MWQIFIFIEQKYLYRANILFIQQTKQIFFIGEKKLWSKIHGLKIKKYIGGFLHQSIRGTLANF